ncbi:MBL fold metallo-hydrolase RNA specificity domain-containing protein [Spirosoma utsteinense]|uniref:Metallo-beta-lactamase family protein n=1 Tax=Spirosoma utsteinense TaxID=2585773 RepID=A0ABR6W8F0_9BACT|nr:MBL fold metallo-hydrolase [Spirosoma utsteinense]MBC3784873.1 metallo-beta-lactamase family protein [Spirosoma utsteinense]MBC3792433.1 metallo-beta-lactamase family protein [Spirosoma utsteinense]
MTIQFFGAARTVTGSKHLITTADGTRILLDCGLFQGINTDELNQQFGFDPAAVDYMVLSHAHIDHTGLIPRLVAKGFEGPIYTTASTIDLCEVMLMDSARIQERDLERVNNRRSRRGQPELEALYNEKDVQQALDQMVAVGYNKPFEIGKSVTGLLTDAAHLLGSAAISLTVREQDKTTQLVFSGDIGRPDDKILRKPDSFPQADYIICESTYGDRIHEPEPDVKAHLLRIVHQTCVEKRGKLLIPAFAVDRTQELIYALDQLETEGKLPRLPVHIDSPMSVKATQVMRDHEEDFNPEILAYIKRDGDAFDFKNLHYVSEVEGSKAINSSDEPCIIIAPSGMAEAGRIKHHIKNNVEDPSTTILMVGYASPSSLGGALKRGDKEVVIFGERLAVNARIEIMDSFSAHGDYREMLHFLSCQDPAQVKTVFLVHGEYEKQLIWKEKLEAAGFAHVVIPDMEEKVDL